MSWRSWRTSYLPLALGVSLGALAIGCRGGGGGGGTDATATPRITAAATTPTLPPQAAATKPSARATPVSGASDIRNEDLAAQPGVLEVLAVVPGQRTVGETVYSDLTGDGVEEAVANINSGGTAGHIAVFVFGYVDGQVRELLREEGSGDGYMGHLQGGVEAGRLVVQWPMYRQGEGNCCPSGGLRVRRYTWDGAALVLATDEVGPRPPAER